MKLSPMFKVLRFKLPAAWCMLVQLIEAAAALAQGLQVREGPREAAEPAAMLAAVAEPDQLPAAAAVRAEPRAAEPPEAAAGLTLDMEADKNGRAS